MSESDSFRSDQILEEVKKKKRQEDVIEVDEKKVKLVIFTLSGNYFALHGEDAKEILTVPSIYYVPGTPDFILGIINVRGDIQSVFDVKIFMEIANSEVTDQSRIIIAEKNGIRSGILVDSVVDVLDIPETSIQQAISTLNDAIRYFVVGEVAYKHHTVTVMDAGKLFEKITEHSN